MWIISRAKKNDLVVSSLVWISLQKFKGHRDNSSQKAEAVHNRAREQVCKAESTIKSRIYSLKFFIHKFRFSDLFFFFCNLISSQGRTIWKRIWSLIVFRDGVFLLDIVQCTMTWEIPKQALSEMPGLCRHNSLRSIDILEQLFDHFN